MTSRLDVPDTTRNHYLTHVVIAIGLAAWFIATRKTLETTAGKLGIALLAIAALQFLITLRALIRVRKRGPVAVAVVATNQLASVTGWPSIKLPAGKYQAFLRVETVGGKRGTLRVAPAQIHELVDALQRRSPDAKISVQNVALHVSTTPSGAQAASLE